MIWQVYGGIELGFAVLALVMTGFPRPTKQAGAPARVIAALLVGVGIHFPVGGRLLGWW